MDLTLHWNWTPAPKEARKLWRCFRSGVKEKFKENLAALLSFVRAPVTLKACCSKGCKLYFNILFDSPPHLDHSEIVLGLKRLLDLSNLELSFPEKPQTLQNAVMLLIIYLSAFKFPLTFPLTASRNRCRGTEVRRRWAGLTQHVFITLMGQIHSIGRIYSCLLERKDHIHRNIRFYII